MKEINLSISAGVDKDNTVVVTAKFETPDDAVAFGEGCSRLYRDASKPLAQRNPFGGNPMRFLRGPKGEGWP